MIQPLRHSREIWILGWQDLATPVPFGSAYILPTVLYVARRENQVLLGHEVVREISQRRVEIFLHRLFQTKGVPDELLAPEDDSWGEDFWSMMAREYRLQINLVGTHNSTDSGSVSAAPLDSLLLPDSSGPRLDAPPREIAQGLIAGTRFFRSPDKRRSLLTKALELAPDLPEALVELADLDLQEGRLEDADRRFLLATNQATIGPDPTHLRARAQHGRLLAAWQGGQLSEAILLAKDLLQASPLDHAGVRFLLPLLLLLNQQTEVAAEFFDRYVEAYPNDLKDPGFLFAWAFTDQERDDERPARQHYLSGMLENLYLAPVLLDLPEPSPDIWQYHERGDLNYALDFAESFGPLWEQRPAATRFLRETYESALPACEAIQQIRKELADLQDNRYEPRYRAIWDELIAQEQKVIAVWKASW
jgi:tetratricopeptide (TPR) repeat protein